MDVYVKLYDTLAPLGRLLKGALTLFVVVMGVALLVGVLLAFGAIVGGVVGAAIVTGYNMLFGVGLSVWQGALFGSIVGALGGGGRAASDERVAPGDQNP